MFKLVLYRDCKEYKVLNYDDRFSRLVLDIGEEWVQDDQERNGYAVEHMEGPPESRGV
jgi:hypothetical protein